MQISSDEIQKLIASGESASVEFKTSFAKEVVETLVAFANADGGTVLVGVDDKREVRGATLGKESLNVWLEQIKSATSPTIIPDISAHTIENKCVVAIVVGEYPVKPVNTKGKYFKRIASANIHIGRFKTPTVIIDDRQITDTLFEAVEQAMKFLLSYVGVSFVFDGSLQRKERFSPILSKLYARHC